METMEKNSLKERFFSMFEACPALATPATPAASGKEPRSIPMLLTFEDAEKLLSQHPTWHMASTDDERRDLFRRWVHVKEEESRSLRQADRRRLLEHLEEGCPWITVETTWNKASSILQGNPIFDRLTKYDQVDVYDAFMAKVEARAVQSQSVSDEIRQRKERQGRIELRRLLKEHLRGGIIHAKLTWKEYLASEGGQEAADAIRSVETNTGGSRPRDLFMDIIEEAEIAYERDLSRIAAVAKTGPNDAESLRTGVLRECSRRDGSGNDNVGEASIVLFLLEEESRKAERGSSDGDRHHDSGVTLKKQRLGR